MTRKLPKEKQQVPECGVGEDLMGPVWEQIPAEPAGLGSPVCPQSCSGGSRGSQGFPEEGGVQAFCALLLVTLSQSWDLEPGQGGGRCITEDSAVPPPSPWPPSSGSAGNRAAPLCKCFCKESYGFMVKSFRCCCL